MRRMIYVSLNWLALPKDNSRVLLDRWWAVHPEYGAAFFHYSGSIVAPQCNQSEQIGEKLVDKGIGKLYLEGTTAVRVPFAYIHDTEDGYRTPPTEVITHSMEVGR